MIQFLINFLDENGLEINDINKNNNNNLVCGDILLLRIKDKDSYNSDIYYTLGILCGKKTNEYYICYDILTNLGMIQYYIKDIRFKTFYSYIPIFLLGKVCINDNKSIKNLHLFCNKCLFYQTQPLYSGSFYQYNNEYKLYLGDVIINDISYTNVSINLELSKANIAQLNNLEDIYKYMNYDNLFMYKYPNMSEVYVLKLYNLETQFKNLFIYSDYNDKKCIFTLKKMAYIKKKLLDCKLKYTIIIP